MVQALMNSYSTLDVARIVGIDKQTLLRWLWAGKVLEPKCFVSGRIKLRHWTDRDIERVREHKEANYRKGRGRKKQML
jgi:MerR HTH family regulatory protein